MTARLSIALVIALAGAARADVKPDQAKAAEYFKEGRRLLTQENDPKRACDLFEQAIVLDPTAAGVMLNLGLCYELQGKYAASLHWFRKAQTAAAEAKPQPLTDYEAEAKKHTQDSVDKVAIGKVDISHAPPDVRITIDNRPVRPEDYLHLEVDNDSVIEARAAGKQVFRQHVEVEGRSAKDVVIVMKDEELSPIRDPGKGRRRLAYVVGAAGVVIYGVTLTYSLVVRARYNDTNDGHYDGMNGYDNAKSDLRRYGTGLFVAGTAAVGAAIALYVTAPKPYRERLQAFQPIVSPDQVGFGYTRSF